MGDTKRTARSVHGPKKKTRPRPDRPDRPDRPVNPDARGLALAILNKVTAPKGPPLDQVLETLLPETDPPLLPPKDRNLAHALVFGVLRWRARLDIVIGHFSRIPLERIAPDVLGILRIGLFQVMFMERVPAFAAVNTAVDLARRSAGPGAAAFVNAVLRQAVLRHGEVPCPEPGADPVTALAQELSFAPWLIQRWLKRWGQEKTRSLCQALNTVAPLTIRVNTLKTQRSRMLQALADQGLEPAPTQIAPDGIALASAGRIPALAGYNQGWFQVQDEAAQLVALAADPKPGQNVLDACAGRGGKTGHLGQLMGNRGTILALDKDPARLGLLAKEMARLGITIAATRVQDLCAPWPAKTPEGFDRIVIDAPCSGLGVLRRNPDAKWRFGPNHIDQCARRQHQILEAAARRIAPGGLIVYAVCSTEPEEGEQVIKRFVGGHPQFGIESPAQRLPATALSLIAPSGFIRTYPHRDGMDGFFIACLRHRG